MVGNEEANACMQCAQPWMQHKIMLNALKIALKTPSFPFFPQACVQKLVIIKSTLVNQEIESLKMQSLSQPF